MNYYHMQMHPNDIIYAKSCLYEILEHKKIIGMGEWGGGHASGVIELFKSEIAVNDIVAIKTGANLIALTQVIGGHYEVNDDDSSLGWLIHRRPIRVLDWEVDEARILPQPYGTLNKCVNDVPTSRIITEWHKRVIKLYEKRGLSLFV